MSQFDNMAPVTGSLTKKYDTVILTGEVYRCKLHPKQLKDVDKAYDVSIKLSAETFKELKKLRLDKTDKQGNVLEAACLPLTGLKQVKLKKRDEDGNVMEDEMGEPIMEFSHCQISVRQNKVIRQNGEEKKVIIPVNMVDDGSAVTSFLNEGSKVSVLVSAYETVFRDAGAMGLNLKEVKVHEAVVYDGGNGGSNSVDPWAAVGMARSEVPSFDEAPASSQPDTPKQEVTQSDITDFEGDIPF